MIRNNKSTTKKGNPKTESDMLFERYLQERDAQCEYEPDIPGTSKIADYKVEWNDNILICEVKGLHEKLPLPRGFTHSRLYHSTRSAIHKARKQFQEHKAHCCVLVLHNISDWEFREYPYVIFGAMLGDSGIRIPLDAEKGQVLIDQAQPAHFTGGKMMHRKESAHKPIVQNKTISAIAVLSNFRPPNPDFEEEFRNITSASRKRLTLMDEVIIRMDLCETINQYLEPRPRVSVFENPVPDQNHPLPERVFEGPYDLRHRYNNKDGTVQRVYVGKDIRRAEKMSLDKTLRDLERFCRSVADKFKPSRIILFGSHVDGTAEPDSDVDLLVTFPGKGDLSRRSLEILEEVEADFPLDLLTRSEGEIKRRVRLNDFFLMDILEKGQVLYEAAHA